MKISLLTVAGAALALLVSVSLGAKPPPIDPELLSYHPERAVTGELAVARVDSTETLVAAWAKEFSRFHPGAKIIQRPGTSLSIEALKVLLDGGVQVCPFVREVQPPEMALARQKLGYDPLVVTIASGSYAIHGNSHALGIFVNDANPLNRLTLTQLDAIYSSTRRRGYPVAIRTWGQLGLTGKWADQPIHAYGMVHTRTQVGNAPGITNYFMHRTSLDGDVRDDVIELPDTALGRQKNAVLADIVAAIAKDRYGIGYSSFADAQPGTKTVALAETADGPFFPGSYEEVTLRHYPLSRSIYVVVKRPPGEPLEPLVLEFLRFILSREGQRIVAEDPEQFLPLPPPVVAEERAKLE